jgi:hypothetical protein
MHINTAVRWAHRVKRDWASYLAARAEALPGKMTPPPGRAEALAASDAARVKLADTAGPEHGAKPRQVNHPDELARVGADKSATRVMI